MGYRLHGRDLVYRGTPNTEYLFCFPRLFGFSLCFHGQRSSFRSYRSSICSVLCQIMHSMFHVKQPFFMKNSWEVSHETKIGVKSPYAGRETGRKTEKKFHVKHHVMGKKR